MGEVNAETNRDIFLRVRTESEVLEDCALGDSRNVYERVAREVTRADGTVVQVWVYVARQAHRGRGLANPELKVSSGPPPPAPRTP
ncbi:hypothetical protein [Streptomyces regalis]|uniref:Gamma-glutamylcyclotransferase AIG2-like domain-containing protein n=1 Tax=Streptomyces regalis TaxID=68262 RepID=A0A101JGB9_9ACTN|nr:hypothetical protein ADL12_32790 [Streptomyces regalis]